MDIKNIKNIKNINYRSKVIILIIVVAIVASFTGYLVYSKQQKDKIKEYVTEIKAYDEEFDKIMSGYTSNELKGLNSISSYSDEQMKFMLTYMRGNASVVINDKYKRIFDEQAKVRNTKTQRLEELIPPDKFKETNEELLRIIKKINSYWNSFGKHVDSGNFSLIKEDVNNLSNTTNELNKIYQQLITDVEYEIEINELKLR